MSCTDKLVYPIEMVDGLQKVFWESLDIESKEYLLHNDLYWLTGSKGSILHVGRTSAEKSAINAFLGRKTENESTKLQEILLPWPCPSVNLMSLSLGVLAP